MFKFTKLSLIALLSALITACGGSSEPKGVIPEAQLEALDKAKQVEDVLMDAQKKRLQEVDG